jgi:hypothetical protein
MLAFRKRKTEINNNVDEMNFLDDENLSLLSFSGNLIKMTLFE